MRPDGRRALRTAVIAACRAIAGPVLPLPPGRRLHCCPRCERDRIAVVEGDLEGPGQRPLRMRCGECGTVWRIVATADEARSLRASQAAQRRRLEAALADADPDRIARALEALLRDGAA